MSEVFDKAVKEGLASLGEIPSPFEVARKLGLNIPTGEDIEDILSIIGPQADIKAMVEESSRVVPALKKGDIPEAISSLGLAALAPFMLGIPGTVSGIRKGSEGLTSRNVGARLPTRLTESFPSTRSTGPEYISQPLKLREFAQKQIEQLKPEDAAKIIGEGKEGLPSLLYHITKAESGKPFKKFKWSKQGEEAEKARTTGLYIKPGEVGLPDYNDFLATTLNPQSSFITSYGIADKSRTLVGLGKVNKLFDFTNKGQIESIIKPLERKELKLLKEHFPKKEKQLKKYLKDFQKEKKLHLEEGTWDKQFIKQHEDWLKERIKKLNLSEEIKESQDRWKRARKEIKNGYWPALENENIKDQMRKLGYDAFTTREAGTNVMLFDPDKQFIPLFDPLKKKSVGFSTGGGLSGLGEK